jgi:uncharacterized tellurite resistance protein B-like protein
MIESIRSFYEKHIRPNEDAGPSERSLQIATAALLIEMTRADFDVSEEEAEVVTRAVGDAFDLSADETDEIVQLAESAMERATSLFTFTSLINEGFSREQKIRVVEMLWQVAYADHQIEAHERHLMRKLVNLLHVSHQDYIAAKFRAREAAGS